jgi:hypothetical protein
MNSAIVDEFRILCKMTENGDFSTTLLMFSSRKQALKLFNIHSFVELAELYQTIQKYQQQRRGV